MNLAIFLSNNVIQAAAGDRNGVQRVYQYEMPEGNMLNGMITNEAALVEQLGLFWNENKLPKTGVDLVVNSMAFSVKKMEFPKLDKKLQTLIPLEYGEPEPEEVPIYDYMPLESNAKGQKDKPLKEIVAVKTNTMQMQQWVGIFEQLQIRLDSINVSALTMYKYQKKLPQLQQGAAVVIGIDDNSLNCFLWIDGEQRYTMSKRFFAEKGTDGFGLEMVRRIDDIRQYYRTLKLDSPLTQIFTFGVDEDSLQVLRENLQAAAMDTMKVEALPGKDAAVMAAAGTFLIWDKDVNLLSIYEKMLKKQKGKSTGLIKYLIAPGIALVLCAAGSSVMAVKAGALKKDVEELTLYVNDGQNIDDVNLVDSLLYEVGVLRKLLNESDTLKAMTDSYPHMNTSVMNQVLSAAVAGVDPSIISYSASNGGQSIEAKVKEVTDCNGYVEALRRTGLFASVDYTGYSFDAAIGMYRVTMLGILNENAGK